MSKAYETPHGWNQPVLREAGCWEMTRQEPAPAKIIVHTTGHLGLRQIIAAAWAIEQTE